MANRYKLFKGDGPRPYTVAQVNSDGQVFLRIRFETEVEADSFMAHFGECIN